MKTYCCGKNAEKDRFAKKWARINDRKQLNPAILPPSSRVKELAQSYIDEIEQIPRLILPGNGDLVLEWETKDGIVSLHLDATLHFIDTLRCKQISYEPVTVERVKELLK